MARLSFLTSSLVLISAANAHFNLNAPPTIGFNEDDEGTAPCGGFTPDFSKNVTDFHVGGEPVGTFLGHPQGNLLYRATLDQTGSSNWTELFPIVQQSGLGNFCEKSITVDSSWVGQKGVFGVVINAPDGLLYQCSIVNFVSGTGTVDSSTCKNGTAQAAFVSDSQLSALVGSSTSGGNGSSTTTPTGSTSTSATTTPTKNAAPGLAPGSTFSTGGALVVGVMVLLGAALL